MKNARREEIVGQTVVVILAAGKGTRMGRPGAPKVCFEIDGVAAINRVIGTLAEESFARFLVVVGHGAERVRETIGKERGGVGYVRQEPQLGTGHAAKAAATALQKQGHEGYVLVTMGDKFIERSAVAALVGGFGEAGGDLALLTIPKTEFTERSGGRVLADDAGQAIDIIESIDVALQGIADELNVAIGAGVEISKAAIRDVIDRHIPNPSKQDIAVAELLSLAGGRGEIDKRRLEEVLRSERYNLEIAGRRYSAEEIEKNCAGVNPSLYLFKSQAFYEGVAMIDNDNAQGEYYLTDVVRHLAGVKDAGGRRKFSIKTVAIENPDWIQGFNSPDELLAIQDYVRRKKKASDVSARLGLKASQYCTVSGWLGKIENNTPELRRWVEGIYGVHEGLYEEKRRDLMRVLGLYGERFGFEEKVCIVRAPGRINLMGRHVDHRGGWNNCLAIDRETIAVAGLRGDDNVEAVNVEPERFAAVKFNIREVMGRFEFGDWVDFVNSAWVRNMLHTAAGDWGNYIKAAMLRLQHQYNDRKIHGINVALCGNVPIAAGLSSSSTIVVATLQAAIALNDLELTARQFIDLCGEGEWFVGSRGGSGDHAAIRLGQRGKIATVGYLPFRVEKMVDAPRDYRVVIANSHVKATKSSSAKDTFNSRIAAYNLGLELLKQRCPEIRAKVRCLRDVNAETLGCDTSGIYRLLLNVPEHIRRDDLKDMLGAEQKDLIETNFGSHQDPGSYDVRGVLLFGIAEIARSKICADYIADGRIEELGGLMRVSHDGDRVSRCGQDGRYVRFEKRCDDEYLEGLIADSASRDQDRVSRAQLLLQPGSYRCSTVEIDRMTDIACCVPGVVGAQIAGAGLGGCIMILAQKESVEALSNALTERYYGPEGREPEIISCIPAEGAGLAEF